MALTKVTGQGLETLSDGVTITTADNTDQLTLTSTDADANSGPNLRLYRNSSSPADDDFLGTIDFEGRNDNSQDFVAARIFTFTPDVSDGSEDAQLQLSMMKAGTAHIAIEIKPDEFVINQGSVDIDFRVESNGNANMLFVDGGNDRVGIGTATPATMLHVHNASGNASVQLTSGTSGTSFINMGDTGDADIGQISYINNGDNMVFSAGAAERIRLRGTSGSNLVVADGISLTDGNLIVAAGHGIDFSAQAANGGATAELLDHYEEGTWTPTIASDAAATAYTTQLGFYTRIGSICHVSATVQISNLGSFAGAVINLQGFPFTISDAANYNPIGSLCLDGTANAKENIFLRFTLNTVLARLEQANGQTTHDNNMNANAFDTGTILKMSGTYIVK